MDSLEIFFSMVNHPIKIAIIKHMNENNNIPISMNALCIIFGQGKDALNRASLTTKVWEMYNDRLLQKVRTEHGTLFELTARALELNKIITNLDYWSAAHELFGGI
ncbi:hypothetical protein [Aerococcus sp. 1KP-2016]|jgi:hypothetical protein|uniref:hypothetical protein n=1 Tax=Aerococcus sp. 1KP-2016 TaxID=1981982 RepID=UPI000B981E29|nr:hypothetical protein [Aerococcus sp. 1KP-2016]OYQ67287.1 hypothetical protein B9P78_04160 [Aerococcus sp. 1KP-2016]